MRRMRRIAALSAATVFLVLAGSLGASARWTTATAPLPATANAATISATLAPATATDLAGEWKYAGSPSTARTALLTYVNTGTSPLAVTLGVARSAENPSTFGTQVQLALWTPAGTTCDATSAVWGTGTLAAPPALPAGFASVAPGATVRLCVATRVATTVAAVQGAAVTATMTLTGRVGALWSTSATSAFSQTVFRIVAPGLISCENIPGILFTIGATARLTWAPVSGVTGYRVYGENGTTLLATVPASATPTVTISQSLLLGADRTLTVYVASYETVTGLESSKTPRALRVVTPLGLGLLTGVECA